MASQALEKLGAAAPAKGKKGAKAPPSKPVGLTELPRDFKPPQLIDRSAIPQSRPTQTFQTAPLSTHAAGTLSLSSRQQKETQPLARPTPAAPPEPQKRETGQLLAPIANAFSGLFKPKPKAPEPPQVETIADLIAKRKNNPGD